jgi:hypothetical protein
MHNDSLIALTGLSPMSPYRATMLHTEAASYLLDGDLDRGDAFLGTALDTAAAGVTPYLPVLLATPIQRRPLALTPSHPIRTMTDVTCRT